MLFMTSHDHHLIFTHFPKAVNHAQNWYTQVVKNPVFTDAKNAMGMGQPQHPQPGHHPGHHPGHRRLFDFTNPFGPGHLEINWGWPSRSCGKAGRIWKSLGKMDQWPLSDRNWGSCIVVWPAAKFWPQVATWKPWICLQSARTTQRLVLYEKLGWAMSKDAEKKMKNRFIGCDIITGSAMPKQFAPPFQPTVWKTLVESCWKSWGSYGCLSTTLCRFILLHSSGRGVTPVNGLETYSPICSVGIYVLTDSIVIQQIWHTDLYKIDDDSYFVISFHVFCKLTSSFNTKRSFLFRSRGDRCIRDLYHHMPAATAWALRIFTVFVGRFSCRTWSCAVKKLLKMLGWGLVAFVSNSSRIGTAWWPWWALSREASLLLCNVAQIWEKEKGIITFQRQETNI